MNFTYSTGDWLICLLNLFKHIWVSTLVFLFLAIYLLKKPRCLSCRTFHNLVFSHCIPWYNLTRSSVFCVSYNYLQTPSDTDFCFCFFCKTALQVVVCFVIGKCVMCNNLLFYDVTQIHQSKDYKIVIFSSCYSLT